MRTKNKDLNANILAAAAQHPGHNRRKLSSIMQEQGCKYGIAHLTGRISEMVNSGELSEQPLPGTKLWGIYPALAADRPAQAKP